LGFRLPLQAEEPEKTGGFSGHFSRSCGIWGNLLFSS